MNIFLKTTIILSLCTLFSAYSPSVFSNKMNALLEPDTYLVPQSELVYLDTTEGQVIIQLLPQISKNHVSQFKQLVATNWYNGLEFYRVIDGFVAQAGEGEAEWDNVKGKQSKFKKTLSAEFTQPANNHFNLVQSPALLAPQTGFIDSVPAGRDPNTQEQWFLHCPGTVAMARGNDANSATAEFYIVIGQAPRHLDRNMSVFGRVVFGMENVQSMPRGHKDAGGVIDDLSPKAQIISAQIGANRPSTKQVRVTVHTFNSDDFQSRLSSAKKRNHEFYVYPGNGNIDVCYHKPQIKVSHQ